MGVNIGENRPLTAQEERLVRWMLEHGQPEAAPFLSQLDRVRVVSRCSCGCASIDFAFEGSVAPPGGLRILADFLFGDDDRLCGAFGFERGGQLAGLEVYGLGVDPPADLPSIESLRPFGKLHS